MPQHRVGCGWGRLQRIVQLSNQDCGEVAEQRQDIRVFKAGEEEIVTTEKNIVFVRGDGLEKVTTNLMIFFNTLFWGK